MKHLKTFVVLFLANLALYVLINRIAEGFWHLRDYDIPAALIVALVVTPFWTFPEPQRKPFDPQ